MKTLDVVLTDVGAQSIMLLLCDASSSAYLQGAKDVLALFDITPVFLGDACVGLLSCPEVKE